MSSRQPAIWFAVFVVFIDALGISIIIPIMPDLLAELTSRPVNETAFIGGVLTAVYALNQFLFGPIIGALSDRYGRRPPLGRSGSCYWAALSPGFAAHPIRWRRPISWMFQTATDARKT